jgi:hypothetical protein
MDHHELYEEPIISAMLTWRATFCLGHVFYLGYYKGLKQTALLFLGI